MSVTQTWRRHKEPWGVVAPALSQIAAPEIEVLRWDGMRGLRGDTENLVNESDLRGNVTFGQPFHLALSDHVHRLVTGDCVQRSFDRSEPQARGNSLLMNRWSCSTMLFK